MFNIYKLFEENCKTLIPFDNPIKYGMFVYKYSGSDCFDSLEIRQIMYFIQFVKTCYKNLKLPFKFDLGYVKFSDKFSYTLFEVLCYYLINSGYNVYVNYNSKGDFIGTAGIKYTPLNILTKEGENSEEFAKSFNSEIYHYHYRKLARQSDNDDNMLPSKIMYDVNMFLNNLLQDKKHSNKISEVVSELVDNSLEHAKSDCLVDVDVALGYKKKHDFDSQFYGVNICIMDFGDEILGTKIKKFFNDNIDNVWYNRLRKAYSFHKKHWSDEYTVDDFFMLAAFQRNISTRNKVYYSGGTGLTKLISALENASDAYVCYVINNNRLFEFSHDCLKFDENEWVGFNHEGDFINHIPKLDNFYKSGIIFPGTAYNLIFVLKEE